MSRTHIDRAMSSYKKPRIRDIAVHRFLFVVSLTLAGVVLLFLLVGMNSSSESSKENSGEIDSFNISGLIKSIKLPKHNHLSKMLENRNQLPPRNMDFFPGVSCNDCKDKDSAIEKKCEGSSDQYGNHRSPKIVSLKHHWWWMMNTVWDGLKETTGYSGDILFIEEDHFIFPNAYRNLKILTKLKPTKCPDCYAANLAPSNVKSRGENWDGLIAERMGNVGYAFNRTVWRKIHRKAREFCLFDDYNRDITMWVTVYPSFGGPVYSMRGPQASAVHFGKCGLHQGQGEISACVDNGAVNIKIEERDKVVNVKPEWGVHVMRDQDGYKAGFRGWGGWGDRRDHQMCLDFGKMYHVRSKTV
ncbi:hypothetical protein L1987_78361 [Smallanthus sonchifolius]|uniref:Uncharacterized protein n=1 Tax=Smallanthus sonchifolius TaxID=185202 RepID=A0ACB8ZGX8_9ASTR|nr:hypothetical protein L1987_78361 [Smallanthus sonchifolius]